MNNKKYYGVILDIDGTLLLNGKALPGAGKAIDTLRSAGYQLRFVSNTTSRNAAQLASELSLQGIKVNESEIQTSVSACLYYLEQHYDGKKGFIAVPDALQPTFNTIAQTADQPDFVVLGDLDHQFNYPLLNRIFNYLRTGANLVVFHKNPWYFRDGGTWLDSGAFAHALEYAGRTEAVVTGKPSPIMFLSALCSMGLTHEQVLVVGDDVLTDIAGARKAKMTALLVGTGKFTRSDAVLHQVPDDHLIPDIAGLPFWLQRTEASL